MMDGIRRKLIEYTDRRFFQAEGKRLYDVYLLHNDFFSLDEDFISFCYANKKKVNKVIADQFFQADFVELCLRKVKTFNTKSNQYLENPIQFEREVEEIYRQLIENIYKILEESSSKEDFSDKYQKILEQHFKRFKNSIDSSIDGNQAKKELYFSEKVCSEYSPELQLEILDLDIKKLKEPILDLGCGENARLVEYLREHNLQAIGVDKIVVSQPYLFSYSWNEFPFSTNSFGTIITHMAFSNHFTFQHNLSLGKPEIYAQIFMKILNALKTNGIFAYAPSVPFFEEFLPANKYLIETIPVGLRTGNNGQSEEPLNMSATKIKKLF